MTDSHGCPTCGYPLNGEHSCDKINAMRAESESYDCLGCGHPMHDTPCQAPVLTHHFEGTNHGGIIPCGHV